MLKGMAMQLENESNVSRPQAQRVLAGKALRALLRLLCQIQQERGEHEGMKHVKAMLSERIQKPHDLTRFRNRINVAIMDARHVDKPYRSANRAISILGTNIVTGLCSYIDGGYFHSRFDNRVNGLLHQLSAKLSPRVQAPLDEADLEALLAALQALNESMKNVEPTSIFFGGVTVKTCLGQLRAVLADCEALPVGWTCVNPTLRLGGCALIKHTILALDSVSPNIHSRPSEVVLALYKLLLDIPATPVQLGYLVISEPRLRQNALEFTYWTDGQRDDYLNRIGTALSGLIDAWMQQENSQAGPAQLSLVRVRPARLHTELSTQSQTRLRALQHQALGKLLYDKTLAVKEQNALRSLADQVRDPEDSACLAFLLIRANKLFERATS